ncbi:TRAP transporter substrate-binding protein [Martelella sp. HB161492]|uniref:TRAP transporter substrate-binding protein n=1 Tax=Martelella sp. HB161492 TaxID=2720726 RepID=UPI001591033A|nr:TRAP transporter substrate-binding protein [Martelella sp. HB161492]
MTITRRALMRNAAMAGAVCAFGRSAFAADTIRWDMADEYNADALSGKAANYFISELKKQVGDQLAITYQGGGALGYKSADQFDAVQDGAVQTAVTLMTQLGGVDPLFNLSSLPFIAKTPEEAYQLWQAARPEYEKIFADNNMVLLWAMPNPPSGIFAKQPIISQDALNGLRIRTYDVNGTQTLMKAGAAPLQIAWSDLIPQLSTGAIDAVLTSADGGVQLSLWDYLSDFTELNYAMGLFMCHVNKDAFDALPQDVQSAMLGLGDACDKYNWQIMTDSIEASYKILRDNGMTVTKAADVPDSVFATLNAAGAAVRDDWVAKTGSRGSDILATFDTMKAG